MDRLGELALFVRIVESGSFSAAAHRLGASKSLASRRIAALEARLGVRLLNRTTRRLGVTETGRRFYERALRILAEIDEAEALARRTTAALRGKLRIAAPMSFGMRHLGPAIAAFLGEHGEIAIDLDLNDRLVDLVGEGYDLAIRIARLADSTLVARTLAPSRMLVCASTDYLAAHGRPVHPEELARHHCLVYSNRPAAAQWRFVAPERIALSITPQLAANNGDLLCEVAVAGLGLVALPDFIVAPALRSGALEPVLPDWHLDTIPIRAVYPAGRQDPRVRRLVDHLAHFFGREPPWQRDLAALGN